MHRFHLPPEQCRDANLRLAGREAHHALHVLRLHPQNQVCVLDGAGREFLCEVWQCHGDTVELRVREEKSHPAPACRVTLLQAVPKGKVFESIIHKATELGTSRVVPLLSERAAVRLDGGSAAQKRDKWQRVAIEAIKQCGAAWLPRVDAPMSPSEFLARHESFDLSLVASLQPGSRPAGEYLPAFDTGGKGAPRSVGVWVGPEGDFTPAELAAIEAAGALPITLGRLVLRSDTAAVYCLSVLNHELLRRESRPDQR
jgi:16S rRNA (uracil1498-N3)-methyltransferase